jgi:predicted AAA+ superfamily ATPase
VNLHALSRDAVVSYETARRYLDVLEDTLILFRIPAWRGSDRASLVAHPKVLLFDLGVRNAILRRHARPAARRRARASSRTPGRLGAATARRHDLA